MISFKTTKVAKTPKLDFSQWTKEEEVKPRTLREIEREVGFPFDAKVVVGLSREQLVRQDDRILQVGAIVTLIGLDENDTRGFVGYEDAPLFTMSVIADFPRWVLLGARNF